MSAIAAVTPQMRDGQNEAEVIARFLAGYAVLWVGLTLMTESPRTSGLAAAFAVAIATGATVLYLSTAAENLGLGTTPAQDAARQSAQTA